MLLTACGTRPPYAQLTIDDPSGAASTATSLVVTNVDGRVLANRPLSGRKFPLTMVLEWKTAPVDTTLIGLSAVDAARAEVARASVEIAPFAEKTARSVTLSGACGQASDCGAGVICYGEQACENGACKTGACTVDVCAGVNGQVTDGAACITDSATLTIGVCLGFVCTVATCGDGYVTQEAGEQCDDGELVEGDGCNGVCASEPGYYCNGSPSVCVTQCGDGIPAGSEPCDDANDDSCDGCLSNCTAIAAYTCGDSFVCGVETCDNGASNSNLRCTGCCRRDCTSQRCGDGVTDPDTGETCDRVEACVACAVTEHLWLPTDAAKYRTQLGVSVDRTGSALVVRLLEDAATCVDCGVIDSPTAGAETAVTTGATQKTVSRVNTGMQLIAQKNGATYDLRARVLFGNSLYDKVVRTGISPTFEFDVAQQVDFIYVSGSVGRRYDSDGVPTQAMDFTIPATLTTFEHDTRVAMAAGNHFAVSWLDGAVPEHFRVRCFNLDHALVGDYDVGTGYSSTALAGSFGAGTYLVAGKKAGDLQVVALGDDCTLSGGAAMLSGFGDVSEVTVAGGQASTFVITWVLDGDLFMRRTTALLAYITPTPLKLNVVSRVHGLSNIALGVSSRIAVGWFGDDGAVYTQRVSADDELLGSEW